MDDDKYIYNFYQIFTSILTQPPMCIFRYIPSPGFNIRKFW